MDLLAFIAMLQPLESLAATHAWLGMGPFPEGPLTIYLARSASLLYGLCGVLLLFLSSDVPRYLPVIRVIAGCGVIAGGVLIGIDIASGMPFWWTVVEGPVCSLIWGIVLAAAWNTSR